MSKSISAYFCKTKKNSSEEKHILDRNNQHSRPPDKNSFVLKQNYLGYGDGNIIRRKSENFPAKKNFLNELLKNERRVFRDFFRKYRIDGP